jgi:nucleoside-diphosphate-sugar epimerase
MLLVAGSTGNLGSEIVRLLRDRGESVRGLVRATSAPISFSFPSTRSDFPTRLSPKRSATSRST